MVIVKSVSISEELNNSLEEFNRINPNDKIRPSVVFQKALAAELKARSK